uniref:Putative RING-H2 finger protein ATL69 n=1 Tax=Populus alba TaxID=43335 RepID=A0A4V6XX12_POPAL|nr:putative RING-H2 finger protein ATL69 [Populus alba]
MLSANTRTLTSKRLFKKYTNGSKRNLKLLIIRASSDESDCNTEECAPEKEAGMVSLGWLAGEKTKVAGTFPPWTRGRTGYVEKDTAGQTDIYSVEAIPHVHGCSTSVSVGRCGQWPWLWYRHCHWHSRPHFHYNAHACTRIKGNGNSSGSNNNGGGSDSTNSYGHGRHFTAGNPIEPMTVVVGLAEPIIDSYTKMVLGESRRLPKPNDGPCSICLSDYQPKDTIRCLPDCHHCFHVDCIDGWLKMSATCPLCRNSPAPSEGPTPVTTPLAEVVPLAFHVR